MPASVAFSGVQIALAAAAGLLLVWLIWRVWRGSGRRGTGAPATRQTLLSESERAFLEVLDAAVAEDGYRVFAKVRLTDVVKPRAVRHRGSQAGTRDRIAGHSADFVLCTPGKMVVAAVIILANPAAERQAKRLQRTLRDHGVPVLIFGRQRSHTCEHVRRRLLNGLHQSSTPELGPIDPPPETEDRKTPSLPPLADAPECPNCGATMVPEEASGRWRCRHYPACRGD